MEECVHRTWMLPLPAKVNKGHNSRIEKVLKSKLCLPFIDPDLVYKFQIICFRGT